MDKLARYALILLSLLGTAAGGRLSVEHLQTGETCPMLGPIPACLFVFAGYALVLVNALFLKTLNKRSLFFFGWTPIFLLAAFGVVLEILGQNICPPGGLGIPQCFYSLAMALICLILFLFMPRNQRSA